MLKFTLVNIFFLRLEDLKNEKLDYIGKKNLDHNQVDMEWKQVKQIIVEM